MVTIGRMVGDVTTAGVPIEGLSADQHLFLARLGQHEGSVGNQKLRTALKWGERRYYGVQVELVQLGLIDRGRGRGGSVRLADGAAVPTVEVLSEAKLYVPVANAVSRWVERRFGPRTFAWTQAEVVGAKGGTRVGGTWRRTDVAVASIRAFEFSPDIAVDLFAFEVKTIANLDVPAIYEAAENSQGATYAYLLVHTSALTERSAATEKFSRIERAGALLGVGIVVVQRPCGRRLLAMRTGRGTPTT